MELAVFAQFHFRNINHHGGTDYTEFYGFFCAVVCVSTIAVRLATSDGAARAEV